MTTLVLAAILLAQPSLNPSGPPALGPPSLAPAPSRPGGDTPTVSRAPAVTLPALVTPKPSAGNVPTVTTVPPDFCTSGPATNTPRPTERYWINLTNEPGLRAFGRIVGGFAVDIIQRELIPGYQVPVTYTLGPEVVPVVYAAPPILTAPSHRLFLGRSCSAQGCSP